MSKRAAGLVALALSCGVFSAPARAESLMTQAFLGNVAANLAVLDTSSKLACSHTQSAPMMAYAISETAEAKAVAIALTDALPLDPNIAAGPAPLLTGRSVAVTGETAAPTDAPVPVLEAANGRFPPTGDLAKLKTLRGAAFDREYFVMQLDALSQIEADYRTYIEQGDDSALVKMAQEQLPGLMRRIEALTRV